nr:prolyl oligopeptidase family serine peptidase [uncultured Brevundimonas sp.]
MSRLFCRCLLAALVLCAFPALAQHQPAFTVEDLVRMEDVGRAAVSPDGRTVAYETFGPWDQSTCFDLGPRSNWTTGRIHLSQIDGGGSRLILADQPPGQVLGDWSPSGRFLSVFGFNAGRWEAGVYEVAADRLRWTGLSPELSFEGARTVWMAGDRLLLPVRPGRPSAWSMRHDGYARDDTEGRWAARDGGRLSITALETQGGVAIPDAARPTVELVMVEATSGQTRTLARGPILDVAPSASGRYIAALERGEGIAPDEPLVQLAATWRSRLRLITVATGESRVFGTHQDVAANLLDWSPDGDRLLVWARRDGTPWQNGDLWRWDADTGAADPLLQGRLDPIGARPFDLTTAIRATWMGSTPVIFAGLPGAERRDWYALVFGAPIALSEHLAQPSPSLSAVASNHLLTVADGAVWRLEAGASAHRLTPPALKAQSRPAPDVYAPQRQQLNRYARRDWAPVFDDGGGAWIVSGEGGRRVSDPQPGAYWWVEGTATAAVVERRAKGVTRLALESARGDVDLATANAGFADLAFADIVDVPHRDRRGQATTSRLFLPPNMPMSQIKGVVVAVYPESRATSWIYDPGVFLAGLNPLALASTGYAVLWAAMPDAPAADRAEAFARNVDLALDAAGAAVPGLPIARSAVIGHSFGGYSAMMIASATRRHKAYVSWAGPSDLAVAWGEFQATERSALTDNLYFLYRAGWAETSQGALGGPPWAKVETYAAANVLNRADRIADPLLIIASDRDVVPMSSGELIFSALHRQGKPARLATYWGEGHWNYSPANMIDVYREIEAWLDRVLVKETLAPEPLTGSAKSEASSPSPPPP